MAIAVGNTRQSLADHYGTLGAYVSLHTGNPGSTGANEASGGGYSRQQTTWSSGSGGTINGSQVEIDVDPGTYNYAGLWSGSGGGATFIDACPISTTTLGGAGKILVTPKFTVS